MLKRLKIKNFRSIPEADLEFGKVNLFIGPNGGGKSNLLEAVGVVSAALGRSVGPEDLNLRGVRLSLPRLFKATFKNRKMPKHLSLTAVTESAEYAFNLTASERSASLTFKQEVIRENGVKLLGRSPRGYKIHRPKKSFTEEISEIPIKPERSVYDSAREFVNISSSTEGDFERLSKYAIYAPQTAILRGMATDPRAVEPLGLTGGRLAAALEEVLRKYRADDPLRDKYLNIIWESGWAGTVSVGKPDRKIVPPQVPTLPIVTYFRDKFLRRDRAWLSAYDASEGTLYLLFVATLLAHPKAPNIFALDNVDGTLNPGLVRKLVSHIVSIVDDENEEDRQVFLTSHNPTAIDALDLFNDDHRVFVVKRNEGMGGTEFHRVQPPPGMSRSQWIKRQKGRTTSVMFLEDMIPGALG
jgi:predicted ATPase